MSDAGGVHVKKFESPRATARVAAISIGVAVAFNAFDLLWTSYAALALVDLTPSPPLGWTGVERVENAGMALYLAALVYAAVTFIRWQRVVIRNGHRFGAEKPKLGWATTCWFIPFVHLVAPLRVFRQIVAATRPQRPLLPLVNAWWTSWVLATLVGSYADVAFQTVSTEQDWLEAAAIDFTASCLRLTAGLLALLLLRRLSLEQEMTAGARKAAPAPEPIT